MLTKFVDKRSMKEVKEQNYMHKVQEKIIKLAKAENVADYGYRKLGEKIGVSHPQKVKHHLTKLLNDGHLIRVADGSIQASSPGDMTGKMASIPILGLANCGQPLAYADNTVHGYLQLSPSLVRSNKLKKLFAVKATGDSMNKATINGDCIEEGDYVLVDSDVLAPSTGDYVVSTIEGLANIKKYVRDEAQQVIALVSESTKSRPPIMVHPDDTDSYHIHGKVVQVIKHMA